MFWRLHISTGGNIYFRLGKHDTYKVKKAVTVDTFVCIISLVSQYIQENHITPFERNQSPQASSSYCFRKRLRVYLRHRCPPSGNYFPPLHFCQNYASPPNPPHYLNLVLPQIRLQFERNCWDPNPCSIRTLMQSCRKIIRPRCDIHILT